jgi:hypothetical protein
VGPVPFYYFRKPAIQRYSGIATIAALAKPILEFFGRLLQDPTAEWE